MKILFCGDPHLKLNRQDDSAAFLTQLQSQVETGNYDLVVILGDLFDSFAVVRTEILALWSNYLVKAAPLTKHVLLVGNHDMAGAEGGVSALEAFKAYPNVTVVDHSWNILAEQPIYFLPFIRSNDEFAKAARFIPNDAILVCHQSFDGAQFENGMYDPHGVDTASVDHLKLVISGHVHKQQKFANIWYPGTPFQHTFGDAGEEKWIFTVDVQSDRVMFTSKFKLDMPTFEVIQAPTVAELKLPTPNFRTNYKIVARGTPAEIAQFWTSEEAKAFKTGAKRVVDALTSINPTAQVVKVTGSTQAEKLKNYVESKTWRTNPNRLLDRAEQLLNGESGR